MASRSQPADDGIRAPRIPELDGLMVSAVVLSCLGLVMYLSVVTSYGTRGEPVPFAKALQDRGVRMVAGMLAFLAAASVPLALLRRFAHWIFLSGAGLCAAAIFMGSTNGAGRWIKLGGFSFQPVEMARFGMVLLVARIVADAGPKIGGFRTGFVAAMAPVLALAVVLILQPDNGNAIFCVALATAMALAAGVRMRWFLLAGLPVALLLLWRIGTQGHVQSRLGNWPDVQVGTHVAQGMTAISAGGAFGQGLGNGWMKMGFVSEARNDFVFAMVGEELGFAGTSTVVLLFALIGWVGYRLTVATRDPFLRMTILGFVLVLCLQAAINMLVATGLAPAKGIDLPFVSSGGTSLMTCFAAVGVIGNAARTDRGDGISWEPARAG